MRARSGHLRTALALLALIGQATPAFAVPLVAATNMKPGASGCASMSCACSPLTRAASACCCSKPQPPTPPTDATPAKPKSCCATHDEPSEPASCCAKKAAPKPTPAETCKLTSTPKPSGTSATIAPGGNCRCDKPIPAATSEPAVPPAAPAAVVLDRESEPEPARWLAPVAADPLPPPAPPPRA